MWVKPSKRYEIFQGNEEGSLGQVGSEDIIGSLCQKVSEQVPLSKPPGPIQIITKYLLDFFL